MGAIEFMNIFGIFDGQLRNRHDSECVKDSWATFYKFLIVCFIAINW